MAQRGRQQWDVEGEQTVRVGGTSVWAGSMLEWGVRTVGEGSMQMGSVGPRWRGSKPIGSIGAA